MEKMYFIVNLHARNGKCQKVWKQIEQQLTEKQIPFRVCLTEYSGHAVELTRRIALNEPYEAKIIVAVGGDGTLHEVVNGAMGMSNITIGFIPGGSGNDFSRGFDIPKDPQKALEFILREKSKTIIDTGEGSLQNKKHYFINNLGVGFDALISKEANQSKLKAKLNLFSLGSLAYAFIVIKSLFTYKCTDMVITIDEQELKFEQVWFTTIANQVYFGGGMKIAPNASATDGLLDIIIVHNLSRWKLLFVFISVFWGGHTGFQEVYMGKGKKVSIKSEKPVFVHADGEIIGETPINIQVASHSHSVFAGKKEGTA